MVQPDISDPRCNGGGGVRLRAGLGGDAVVASATMPDGSTWVAFSEIYPGKRFAVLRSVTRECSPSREFGHDGVATIKISSRLQPGHPTALGSPADGQLLVDGGHVTGIIDWGDVCRSDPGVDLQLAWSLLPPAARDEFVDEYGPDTDESLLRARVVALFLNAVLARYGSAEGMPTVAAEALASLRRASAGL